MLREEDCSSGVITMVVLYAMGVEKECARVVDAPETLAVMGGSLVEPWILNVAVKLPDKSK